MSSASPGTARWPVPRPATWRRGHPAAWAVALVLVGAAAATSWAGRDIALLGDEWAWIFGGLNPGADTILQSYNGHLLATTWSAYYGLLVTFGLPNYWVYRTVALLLHLGVALVVFLLARRRIGPWSAIAPAAAIAFLGTGSDVFLSGNFGIAWATVACVGALAMLDRRTRGRDLAACTLLVLGLASFTSAIAFTAGIWVEVLSQRDRWRRIWVPLLPTLLYLSWRLIWGGDLLLAGSSTGDLAAVVRRGFEAAAGAIAGLGGVQLTSPTVEAHFPWLDSLALLAVALGALALVALLIRRRNLSPRLANLIVTAVALWALLALGRGSLDLFASRYVYLGAIVVALILVELASGLRLRSRAVTRAVVLAVGVSVALNVAWLVIWGNALRRESTTARAELAALDIARGEVPAEFEPSRAFRLRPVTAGAYFEAVWRFGGSPALANDELRRASEADREAADRVLVGALGLRLVPGAAPGRGPPPVLEGSSAASIDTTRSCLKLTPSSGFATLDFVPRSPGVVLETGSGGRLLLHARRFGERFEVAVGGLRGGAATLDAPLGHAPDPWHLRLVSNARTSVCSRRP